MGYRVRNRDGEVRFESFRDLSNAYRVGLVEPEDEILQDGHQKWRAARTVAHLQGAPRESRQPFDLHMVTLIVLCLLALVAAFTLPWWVALVLAVLAVLSANRNADRVIRRTKR
jgi:Flp pilus assembly protein TadB